MIKAQSSSLPYPSSPPLLKESKELIPFNDSVQSPKFETFAFFDILKTIQGQRNRCLNALKKPSFHTNFLPQFLNNLLRFSYVVVENLKDPYLGIYLSLPPEHMMIFTRHFSLPVESEVLSRPFYHSLEKEEVQWIESNRKVFSLGSWGGGKYLTDTAFKGILDRILEKLYLPLIHLLNPKKTHS